MSFRRYVLRAGAALATTGALAGGTLAADAAANSNAHAARVNVHRHSHKKSGAKNAAPTFKPVPSNQDVSLTMETYLPLISSGANTTLNSLISGFEAAHPNIKVTLQTTTATTGAATTATVQQDEAAGNTPDVVQTGMDMVDYLANGLGGQDLDKVVGLKALQAEWGGDHPFPRALQVLGQINGQQYAIPWVLSTPVLYYNASLFQQAGLNPSDPPKTWSQLEQDALKIKQATGAAGLSDCAAGAASVNVDWCTQSMVRSDGGSVLSFNGKKLTWTDPATVAAFKELGALGSSGAMVNLSSAQAVQEFGSGQLAMVINSSAAQGALLSAIQGHGTMLDAEIPGFGNHPAIPVNSGSGLSILSKTPLKQRAAWELIEYLTSDEAFTQITENVGYAPLRVSLATDPKYLASWAHTQSLVEANLDQLKELAPWQDYPGPNFGQIEALLETAAQQVAFSGQSASSALSQAQSQANALLK